MDGGKTHTHTHHTASEQGGRERKGTHRNGGSNKAETVLQVEKDEKDPRHQYGQGSNIRAMNFEPFAFRINGEALPELLDEYLFKHKDREKEKGEVRPLQGHHREATPHRTGSGIHTQR